MNWIWNKWLWWWGFWWYSIFIQMSYVVQTFYFYFYIIASFLVCGHWCVQQWAHKKCEMVNESKLFLFFYLFLSFFSTYFHLYYFPSCNAKWLEQKLLSSSTTTTIIIKVLNIIEFVITPKTRYQVVPFINIPPSSWYQIVGRLYVRKHGNEFNSTSMSLSSAVEKKSIHYLIFLVFSFFTFYTPAPIQIHKTHRPNNSSILQSICYGVCELKKKFIIFFCDCCKTTQKFWKNLHVSKGLFSLQKKY